MGSTAACMRRIGLAFGLALAMVSLASAQQNMAGKTAEQAYKNITVLNGTPADQLMPSMRLMNTSLNVSCEHCHVADDEANDSKMEKKTSREMITMVLNINKTSFGGRPQVTCYTCHLGSTNPGATPPLAGPDDHIYAELSEEPTRPTNLPTGDQIFAKYAEALGGEANLRKVTSREITSVANLPSGPRESPRTVGQIDQLQKAPNLSVVVTKLPTGTTATGFNGTAAWTQNAMGRVATLDGTDLARAKRDADFYLPLNLKQNYTRVVVRGTDKVGDREAYVVIATPQGDSAERLFFDTQTGLLLRRVTTVPTPIGLNPIKVDYEDYRDVGDGTKFPYLMRVTAVTARRTFYVQKVQDNAAIDNSKFTMPESKPAPPAAAPR
jgi:outer membrane lipoprotein-sorting protein